MKLTTLFLFIVFAGCSQRALPEITPQHPAHPAAAESAAPVFTIADDVETNRPENNPSPDPKHSQHEHASMGGMR